MNSNTGKNRMKDHSKKWERNIPGLNVCSKVLHLFSLDYDEMQRAQKCLTRHRGPLSYLSLNGVKDIILESTGLPLPLLHVQWGALAAPQACALPQQDHVHMFCAVEDSELAQEVESELNIEPSGSATIYSIRMKTDYSFVLTSDI